MNLEHVKAIVWLRSRILANSFNRKGKRSTAFAGLLISIILVIAGAFSLLAFFVGKEFFEEIEPINLMFFWDVIVVGYLLLLFVSLAVSVQKDTPLSIGKLLHLPVSPVGAFISNFLSSFAKLSNIVALPIMLGFGVALIAAQGVSQFVVIPLSLSLVFMMTALVYQLEAWLAILMSNKRMAIIVVVVLMLPVMIGPIGFNILMAHGERESNANNHERWELIKKLDAERDAGEMDQETYAPKRAEIMAKYDELGREIDEAFDELWLGRIDTANRYVPIGWVPLGVQAAANGKQWPGWAGIAGMLLVGGLSLTRSYKLTLDITKGRHSASKAVSNARIQKNLNKKTLVGRKLPFVSERISAIATANMRVLLRAPEVKMQILVPLIILGSLGSAVYLSGKSLPEFGELSAAWIVLALMSVGAFAMLILIENQFLLDGNGFRNFLLLPTEKHEVLVGKNLAASPIGLGYGIVVLGLMHYFFEFELATLFATCIQLVSICILLFLIANMVGIYLPQDPSAPKLAQAKREMLQGLVSILTMPVVFFPVYIPLLLAMLFRDSSGPVYVIGSAVVCALVLFAYGKLVVKQGKLLQKKEIWILEKVAPKQIS